MKKDQLHNIFKFAFPAALLLSLGLAILLLLPEPEEPIRGWGAFGGRFHPLIVHFPIVLVVLPLLLELWNLYDKKASFPVVVSIIWGLAVLSSVGAVIAGYLLYASGEYSGDLVKNHLWGGVGVAILSLWCGWAWLFYRNSLNPLWHKIYLGLLILTNGLVIYTGDLGGSLTHGEDFLSDAMPVMISPESVNLPENPKELRVYEDLLMPAFKVRCMSCHNAHKAKGGLIMATFDDLMKGGKTGKPMLIPGQPDSSELYRRVILPSNDDDHMPPEGKPPLKSDEISLLRWWIEKGAEPDNTVGEGINKPEIKAAIDRYLPRLLRQRKDQMAAAKERAKLAGELEKLGDRLGLVIQHDPEADSLYFAISMQLPPLLINDATLTELQPYADAFSRISLVSAEITDDGLYYFSTMPNLQKLLIHKTCIDGSGLEFLKEIPSLEILNLSHTDVDDYAALKLIEFPHLRQVYLHNTKVGENMIFALDKYLSKTLVSPKEGPYY